jgi:PAS domain S-box-containing protein
MKNPDRKRTILTLRWAVIILTSYLIVFGKGRITAPDLGHFFILIYILSNLILIFLPKTWFSNPKFFYFLVVFDTAIVSLGMYLSERVATDFYLVFFLILILASVSRSFKLLMIVSGITASLYGFFLYSWGLLGSEQGASYILRIPFIFILSAFYGYIIQTFTKESQEQRVLSEDKYRGLFENAKEGIVILRNPELQIADVNGEAGRLIGNPKKEVLQKDVVDLFDPLMRERALSFFEQVVKDGEGATDTLSLKRENGVTFEVDLSVKRIDLEDDSFFQLIFKDLTERRKLEKKIRESKRSLQAIVDGIQDSLFEQNLNYVILRVNKAVAEKTHLTYEQLIGKKCYEIYCQRTQPCPKCPATMTFQTKQLAHQTINDADSDTVSQISSFPILDDKGNLFSVVMYVRDVTEDQRLQEQLIQSEKLAGIGILASGVAHEINNPLSGTISMAEAALEEDDISVIRDYLADIINCSQRISEIVTGLRSYSRIARQDDRSLLDLNSVLEDSLKMVRLGVKSKPVEAVKQFQLAEKMEGNLGEMQQVFTNLITNAFHAMEGREGVLTLTTRSLRDFVEVGIGDNGIGISEKHIKKIFDPFFTTKKIGEGTGLGLNIVYRIVTKYGGTVEVESEEGVGTTFRLRFPLRREEK